MAFGAVPSAVRRDSLRRKEARGLHDRAPQIGTPVHAGQFLSPDHRLIVAAEGVRYRRRDTTKLL